MFSKYLILSSKVFHLVVKVLDGGAAQMQHNLLGHCLVREIWQLLSLLQPPYWSTAYRQMPPLTLIGRRSGWWCERLVMGSWVLVSAVVAQLPEEQDQHRSQLLPGIAIVSTSFASVCQVSLGHRSRGQPSCVIIIISSFPGLWS